MRPTTLTAYRWELRKLVSQKRTYIGIGAAAALPILFVTVMALQKGGPYDAPLGHNLRKTGIALTLVVLTFVSRFGAQLMTALVAGDIVACEDSGVTLKLILTRSLRRGQILGGKILATFTYVVALLLALLAAGLVAGTIAWGFHPLVNFSLTRLSAGHALALTFAALGIFAVPLLAIASFGIFLSVLTRNSAAAIVGTLVYELVMEAIVGLVHVSWLQHYLHNGPLMPCALDASQPTRFDGRPRVVGMEFQLAEGKLVGPRDLLGEAAFDRARQIALEVADYIRRMGPFEPGRLPHDEMEYTTMPEIAERLQGRWRPLEPAEPARI